MTNAKPSLGADVYTFLAAQGDTHHWTVPINIMMHDAVFGTDMRDATSLTVDAALDDMPLA